MHGVSDPFVSHAFEIFGFPPFIPVKEQQQPDPEFSTVAFPNPEEKGKHFKTVLSD
jgi:phosphoglucomutase